MTIKRLIDAVSLLMLVTVLAGCGGAEERKEKHIEKAKSYFQAKNYVKARVEAKNALQIVPKDVAARLLYARIEEKLAFAENSEEAPGVQRAHMQNALNQYRKVLGLDENNADAKSRLAVYYIQYYKVPNIASKQKNEFLKTAKSYAEDALALQKKNADAMAVLARVSLFNKNLDIALDKVDTALKFNADNYFALETKVLVLHEKKRLDQAVSLISEAASRQPENILLSGLLAKLYLSQKKPDAAVKVLQQLVETHPANKSAYKKLISLYVHLKQNDKALSVYNKAIENNPDDQLFKTSQIMFLDKYYGKEKSLKQADSLIKRFPDNYDLKLQKAALLLKYKNVDGAIGVYQSIIKSQADKPVAIRAKINYARVLLSQGKLKQTEKLVVEILAKNPQESDGLLLKAHLAVRQGDYQTAIANYQTILSKNPNSISLQKSLAVAFSLNKNDVLAREVLQKAARPRTIANKKTIDGQAAVMLAKLYLKDKDYGQAKKQYENILEYKPRNFYALSALLEIDARTKDYDAARLSANKIKKYYPKSGVGDYFLGLIYRTEGNNEKAIKHLRLSHQKEPKTYKPLAALAATYVSMNKTEEAIEVVSNVVTKYPDNLSVINLLGKLYLKNNNKDKAEQLLQDAVTAKPEIPASYFNLASLYMAFKQTDKAVNALKTGIVKTGKKNEGLKFMLATVYQYSNKVTEAIELYEELLSENPDRIAVANNLALLLVADPSNKSNMDRALNLIEPMESTNNPYLLDTVGWVKLQAGQVDTAIRALQQAASKLPKVGEVQYHLGMAYYRRKDIVSARQYLEQAVNTKQKFTGLEEAKTILAKLMN